MSISPNVPSPQESYHYESAGTPRWIGVLFGVVIALLAVLGYAGYSTQSRLSQDLAKQQDQSKILTAQLDQANTRLAEMKGHLEVTEQKVGMTQAEISKAQSRAESIRKEQQTADQKLTAQRVGPVQVTLNKTDPKKSKYTVTVVADDKTIEKKDKTSGEPVQFYVAHSRGTPYEFVVFDVGRDRITGYLSTPKEAGGAAAAAPATTATPSKP